MLYVRHHSFHIEEKNPNTFLPTSAVLCRRKSSISTLKAKYRQPQRYVSQQLHVNAQWQNENTISHPLDNSYSWCIVTRKIFEVPMEAQTQLRQLKWDFNRSRRERLYFTRGVNTRLFHQQTYVFEYRSSLILLYFQFNEIFKRDFFLFNILSSIAPFDWIRWIKCKSSDNPSFMCIRCSLTHCLFIQPATLAVVKKHK